MFALVGWSEAVVQFNVNTLIVPIYFVLLWFLKGTKSMRRKWCLRRNLINKLCYKCTITLIHHWSKVQILVQGANIFPSNPTENSVLDHLEIHWGWPLARASYRDRTAEFVCLSSMMKSMLQKLFTPLSSLQKLFCLSTLHAAVGMTQVHLEVHPGGSTAGVRGVLEEKKKLEEGG